MNTRRTRNRIVTIALALAITLALALPALADGPEAGADQPSLERKLDRLEQGLAPARI